MIPTGMTGAKLRLLADWLDTYDSLVEAHVNLLTALDVKIDGADETLTTVRGTEVQDDLRRWADEIDATPDESWGAKSWRYANDIGEIE